MRLVSRCSTERTTDVTQILESTDIPTIWQSKSTLLSVSDEILLNIASFLPPTDSACLALTCKKTAAFYSHPTEPTSENKVKPKNKLSSPKFIRCNQLKSGEEEYKLGALAHGEPMSDDSEWEDYVATMKKRFGGREDGKVMARFHRRLDEGWNKSNSRFCHACTKFVSTSEEFWEKRVARWLYLDAGIAGTNFRQVADCDEHEGSADAVVEDWIKHGKGGVELKAGRSCQDSMYTGFMYLKCPLCIFSSDRAAWCECSEWRFDGLCSCIFNRD